MTEQLLFNALMLYNIILISYNNNKNIFREVSYGTDTQCRKTHRQQVCKFI